MFERYTAATDGSRSIHRLVDLNGDAGKLTGGVFHDVTEIHYDVQASDYPSDGQLQQVHSGTKPAERKLQATYLYYLHGPLKRIELADQLQGIDFVYNINGSLKSINHADPAQDPGQDGAGNGFGSNVFGQSLEYFERDYVGVNYQTGIYYTNTPEKFNGIPRAIVH